MAERLGLGSLFPKAAGFLISSFSDYVSISLMNMVQVRRFGLLIFAAHSLFLQLLHLLNGSECSNPLDKCCRLSFQPSEFMKQAAIFAAWIFSLSRLKDNIPELKLYLVCTC